MVVKHSPVSVAILWGGKNHHKIVKGSYWLFNTGCSCTITFDGGVSKWGPAFDKPPYIHISSFQTVMSMRRRGYATELLKYIAKLAKRTHRGIKLEAAPYGIRTMPIVDLVAMYSKIGLKAPYPVHMYSGIVSMYANKDEVIT